MDGLSTDGGDLETDYQGRLSSVTNIPRQPDYLLGLATGRLLKKLGRIEFRMMNGYHRHETSMSMMDIISLTYIWYPTQL